MITVNRADRIWQTIEPHYKALMENSSKKVKKQVSTEKRKFDRIKKKLLFVGVAKLVCFVLLYISAFAAIIPFLSHIAQVTTSITGIVGTTVFLALLSILTWLGNLYATDAQAIASYITAVMVKYSKDI